MTSRALISLFAAFAGCAGSSNKKTEPAPTSTTPPTPVAATTSEPSTQPEPGEPAPSTAAPSSLPAHTFAAGPFEVRAGKKPPAPPTTVYKPRKNLGEDMEDHAWIHGWTEDGSAFVYCTPPAGAGCEECTYTGLDGKKTVDVSGKNCDDGISAAAKRALRARLAERKVALRDGTWAYGGDLVVTTREVRGGPDGNGDPRAILKVGAARRDGSVEGEAYEVDGCYKGSEGRTTCFLDAHADVIAPSPDGATVAILGHMWAGEWSDTFTVALIPAGRIAAAAYNRQGLDALARQDFAAAAAAFVAATRADEKAWKGPYNLACAHARAGDPQAEAALRLAVERDGEAVRKRAATDKDLDGVRAQAWFTALVGSPPAK